MDQDFGIAAGLELVSASRKLRAQLVVIVDFSVENCPDGAVFVAHGLLPACNVGDAKAAHADCTAAFDVEALMIGPAVPHEVAHSADFGKLGRSTPEKLSGNATHGLGVRRLAGYSQRRVQETTDCEHPLKLR